MQIFELDETKRITVPGILAHPWYGKPLPPVLEQSLQSLTDKQVALEAQVGKASGASRVRAPGKPAPCPWLCMPQALG